MSGYVPTTDEIRLGHLRAGSAPFFDRWLAEHDQQVQAQTLRDEIVLMRAAFARKPLTDLTAQVCAGLERALLFSANRVDKGLRAGDLFTYRLAEDS